MYLVENKLDGKTHNVMGELCREACDKGTILSFRIVSNSMNPLIEIGDVVKVRRAEPSRVSIGDVVAFHDGPTVVIHRVIGKGWLRKQLIFRHRGDAGAVSGRIPAKNLIGKVSVVKKKDNEISLDAPGYAISNKLMGWRLRLLDMLGGIRPKSLSFILHQSLRPAWKLCRKSLLRRL